MPKYREPEPEPTPATPEEKSEEEEKEGEEEDNAPNGQFGKKLMKFIFCLGRPSITFPIWFVLRHYLLLQKK